jgi:hypothetical protein
MASALPPLALPCSLAIREVVHVPSVDARRSLLGVLLTGSLPILLDNAIEKGYRGGEGVGQWASLRPLTFLVSSK